MVEELDLSTLPKEMQIIIKILSVKHKSIKELSRGLSFPHLDWNLFLKLAVHHRLYPVLYLRLKEDNQNLIPSFVLQSLSRLYQQNTFRMLPLAGEMVQVNRWFAEEQIDSIFLKGPILAHILYGDYSHRTSADLDVLIPLEKLDKADQILKQKGYEKDEYISSVLGDWKWRHHHMTYLHKEKGIKVEVHWRLNPGPGNEPSFAELWQRRSSSQVMGSTINSLGNNDLLLFLITHGARHGWSRLRWLYDIHQCILRTLYDDNLCPLLKKYDAVQMAGQCFILANQIFGTPQLSENYYSNKACKLAQETLFYIENMIELHNEPLPEIVSKYHSRYLFHTMSKSQKVFFVLSFLYPYPDDAKTLPLPKSLHFLYFPLRPFLWAWRKSKRQAVV